MTQEFASPVPLPEVVSMLDNAATLFRGRDPGSATSLIGRAVQGLGARALDPSECLILGTVLERVRRRIRPGEVSPDVEAQLEALAHRLGRS